MATTYVMLNSDGDIVKMSNEDFSEFDDEVHTVEAIEHDGQYVCFEKDSEGNIVGLTDEDIMARLTPPPDES